MKTPDQLITEAKSQITEISVQELHEKYLQHPDIILIDVREPEEHQACAIDRAVNFPRGMLEMKIAQHPVVNHYCDVERALTNLAERDIYLTLWYWCTLCTCQLKPCKEWVFEKVFSCTRRHASLDGSWFTHSLNYKMN